MQKVLVTGANGFIGRALCQRLLDQGDQVVAVVRAIRNPLPGVNYQVADLESAEALAALDLKVDCVIHLAGRAHVLRELLAEPLAQYRKVNRDVTLQLARQAMQAGVRRFVFVSSIGVNGAQTFHAAFTEQSPQQPHADYAVSKREAEDGLQVLLAGQQMEWVIVRPPMVYDHRAPGNFARLLKLVASGLPLPLGSATNERSLVSLVNLAGFLTLLARHPAAAREVFLIADGHDVSTSQLIRLLAQGMGVPARLFPVPPSLIRSVAGWLGRNAMYTQLFGSLQVDASKARSMLGWEPEETAENALRDAGRAFKPPA
jgi:nucleoside-diphosphate-sugar epimerase